MNAPFIRNSETHQPEISVKGQRIEVVSHLKYLGIIIDSNLSFKKEYIKYNEPSKAAWSFQIDQEPNVNKCC